MVRQRLKVKPIIDSKLILKASTFKAAFQVRAFHVDHV